MNDSPPMHDSFSPDRASGRSFALNGRTGPAGSRLRKGISELLADAIELVELQLSLFKLNAHQAKERAIWPIAFLSAGAVLALAAMPVLLVAIGFALHELANLPRWAAFGITFFVATLLGGLAAFIAFKQLTSLTRTFDDSTAELERNVTWLKTALRPDAAQPTDEERYRETLKAEWERQHSN